MQRFFEVIKHKYSKPAQAKMKLLAIVIICGFGVRDSLCLVDSSGLSSAFVSGGNTVAASTIEGQLTENLRGVIVNETALYITHIVNDLARQIDIQNHLEVGLLKLALETFNYELEQMPAEAAPDSLDIALQSLNQKIAQAFDLIPTTLGGNLVSKPKTLSTKKDKPSSSSQKPSKAHTLTDFMTNLAQILETDLSALQKFVKKLMSASFEGVSTAYASLQDEFRLLALNDIVPAIQSIVRDIEANQLTVQSHVNAITWNKFTTLNIQLNTIVTTSGITEATTEATVTTEAMQTPEVTDTVEQVTEVVTVADTETPETPETITELPPGNVE